MNMIVGAVAALTGGIIANYFGFRILFVVMFVISLFGLVVSTSLLKKAVK